MAALARALGSEPVRLPALAAAMERPWPPDAP
jgi:hypothetical protein